MNSSGTTTFLRVGDVVRIFPWVEVVHAQRYWDTVQMSSLSVYKSCQLKVLRLEDDGTYGIWAQLQPARHQDGQGIFWIKTCLLTLASDPELV